MLMIKACILQVSKYIMTERLFRSKCKEKTRLIQSKTRPICLVKYEVLLLQK